MQGNADAKLSFFEHIKHLGFLFPAESNDIADTELNAGEANTDFGLIAGDGSGVTLFDLETAGTADVTNTELAFNLGSVF